jgi:hypothetical protein
MLFVGLLVTTMVVLYVWKIYFVKFGAFNWLDALIVWFVQWRLGCRVVVKYSVRSGWVCGSGSSELRAGFAVWEFYRNYQLEKYL